MPRDVRTVLEEAAARPSDDLDVARLRRQARLVRRRRHMRHGVAVAAAAVLAVVGASVVFEGLRRPDVAVNDTAPGVPEQSLAALHALGRAVVVGDVLVGVGPAPVQLGAPPHPANAGVSAAPDDPHDVVYSTVEGLGGQSAGEKVPASVRQVDVATGDERVLVDGALTVARRSDGAIATVVGGPFTAGEANYPGDLVVVADGTRERWSDRSAGWAARAWAGDRLVVERTHYGQYGSVEEETLVFDGPGQSRLLGEPGRNRLVAIGPDGRLAILRHASGPAEAGDPGELHLVDLASGKVIDRWSPPGRYLVPEGDWTADTAVVQTSATDRDGPSTDLEVLQLQVTPDGFGAASYLDPGLPDDDQLTVASVTDAGLTPDGGLLIAVRRLIEGVDGVPPQLDDVQLRHCASTCRTVATTSADVSIIPR